LIVAKAVRRSLGGGGPALGLSYGSQASIFGEACAPVGDRP